MSGICTNPLQCIALHEMRCEIAEMNSKLSAEIAQISSRLTAEMVQINSKLTSLSASIQIVVQCSQDTVTPSNETTNVPLSVPLSNFDEQMPNDSLEWSTNGIAIEQSEFAIKQEDISDDSTNSAEASHSEIFATTSDNPPEEGYDILANYQFCAPTTSTLSAKKTRKSKEVQSTKFTVVGKCWKPGCDGDVIIRPKRHNSGNYSEYYRCRTCDANQRTANGTLDEIRERSRGDPIKQNKNCQSLQRRFCKICHKVISFNWRAHVASIHLNEPCLCCNLCDFTSKWHLSFMKTHFSQTHDGIALDITDKKQQLANEIERIGQDIIDFAEK